MRAWDMKATVCLEKIHAHLKALERVLAAMYCWDYVPSRQKRPLAKYADFNLQAIGAERKSLLFSKLFIIVVESALGKISLKSTGPMLFEVQAKWVLRNPTQFGSRSQNRFCLYLDPPIGPFGLRRHVRFSFSEKFISCSAQQQSGFFIQHF